MEATDHEGAEGGDGWNFSHLASYFLAILNIPQVIGHHFAFFFFFFGKEYIVKFMLPLPFSFVFLLLNNKDEFGYSKKNIYFACVNSFRSRKQLAMVDTWLM